MNTTNHVMKTSLTVLGVFASLLLVLSACHNDRVEVDPLDKVIKIKDLNQLGTVEYKISKIVAGEDNLTWYKIGNRKILFSCEAVIKAGIDLGRLKQEDVSIVNGMVNLKLPKAEIIYIKVDHNSIKEEFQEIGSFRSEFTNKEKDELLTLGEKSINDAIPDMGIIPAAENNVRLFLSSYLKARGFKDVSIEFY